MTGASDNVTADFVSSNQIVDYSFVIQPFKLDEHNATLRCASGLGPFGNDPNTALGGWYFNSKKISVLQGCKGPVFEVRQANPNKYPGVINLYLCKTFTVTEEGVYSCIMTNSSMMNETTRVGVYLSSRSESIDMYPITSLLTMFHLSTQLLQ